ncbi:MAG: zinc-dependent metalloprotease [Deltaproteobacteria bacterium]
MADSNVSALPGPGFRARCAVFCTRASWLLGLALVPAACVDHRPIRNGLLDEHVYLTKTDLTGDNPKLDRPNDGWLFKTTVVKTSSPNVLGDYAFPGFESGTQYVRFQFKEDKLQVTDGQKLQQDDADDPNDDLATNANRVLFEFDGQHVDVQLRESLDGERTNYLEENTEQSWQERKTFRVDFETTNMDPIASTAWFYGDYIKDCANAISKSLVPDSFEWDADDQYLSFLIEVNYDLNLITSLGGCWNMVSLATGVGTSTIQYRLSFYRPGASDYVPEAVAEKDEVNKKYGAFQVLDVFRDEESGLLSAKTLLQRWNPNRTEPVVFYFHEGFPDRFKPMFEEIKEQTNQTLEQSGAKLRFDFREYDEGGKIRNLGDVRYSFVTWNQDVDTTRGLLGYGPSSSDPRTGEVLSANLNLYNIGMDYYRFLIQDFLEANGALKPDPAKKWEETACEAGQTLAPVAETGRLKSTLFDEMRRVMDLPASTADSIETKTFIPTPTRGQEAFMKDLHRTLGEYRYSDPGSNQYVYRPSSYPLQNFAQRQQVEREFQEQMGAILSNQDPLHGAVLHSRAGIQAQLGFVNQFRQWKQNHQQLKQDEEMLLGLKNISVFNANDAIGAIAQGARRCTDAGVWESNEQYSERIIEDVVFHVGIHEFGHNLGLRHNFYGSVDQKHMRENEVSASVMDYVYVPEEVGSHRGWGGYDQAALTWIYGTPEKRSEVMAEDFLYCTDEHRSRSPLCSAFDLGVTPSQIVLNGIERYDWLYSIRNQRAYRTFWDTGSYVNGVYSAIYDLQRLWYLSIFDWGGGGVQDVLKRLDQKSGQVLTDPEYDEISTDFYNDAQAAVGLTMAFYDSVINQPASFRDYQTKFDPFYGDILRIGISVDKLYTMFAFMDQQEVSNYSPNVNTFVSMYDQPFGARNLALSQRVLDDMLGASYDTFPWFRFTALGVFADVTNGNLVSNIELKDRIAIRRYEDLAELTATYGADILERATGPDNPEQLFTQDGQEYVYTFLDDQGWYLVASRSRSPVSYQYMRDYNQSLNAGASGTLDDYGLKILLAYYEFYNNFVGF